jgi:hypothetical protein
MDFNDELANLELLLRELVLMELGRPKDDEWTDRCQISQQLVTRWRKHRDKESESSTIGALGTSLLHYASFMELCDVISLRWDLFEGVFGDKNDFRNAMLKLTNLRDPDAHRRPLMMWQKHLILGLVGELRTQIVRFRADRLNPLDYKPRFVSAYDSEGYVSLPEKSRDRGLKRSGEAIQITVFAEDPQQYPVEYRFFVYGIHKGGYEFRSTWSFEREFTLPLMDAHVTDNFTIGAECRRVNPNDPQNEYADLVLFEYVVLPSFRAMEGV